MAASPDGRFLAFVGECVGPGPDYAFGCPVEGSAGLGFIVVDLINGDVALTTMVKAPDRATTPTRSHDGQWTALATGDPQDRSSRNVVAVNRMRGDEIALWSSAEHWRESEWDVAIDALAWQTSVSATGSLIMPTSTEMPVTDEWMTYTSERYGAGFEHPAIYGQGRSAGCLPEDMRDDQIFYLAACPRAEIHFWL